MEVGSASRNTVGSDDGNRKADDSRKVQEAQERKKSEEANRKKEEAILNPVDSASVKAQTADISQSIAKSILSSVLG